MKGFKPYNPKQIYFLPPSPTDWLPENHLAYFIDEVIDALDLRPFYQDYEGESRGQPPFDPAMMLKIITYGYCTGCFSSRRLEAKLREDLPFIYLAGGNRPDHRTIAAFRQRHRQRIHDLFVQVLQIAQKAGLVRQGPRLPP
jgi:transposase